MRFYQSLLLLLSLFTFSLVALTPPSALQNMQKVPLMSFEEMLGKKSKSWKNLSTDEDFQLLAFYKDFFDKRRAFYEAANGECAIPKVVHFIWLGPKNFPPESVKNVRSWIAKNPGWKFKFWTDRNRLLPCLGCELHRVQDFSFQFLKKEYDESDNFGEKSDILRYEILYHEGGLYTDHDSNCLHSFEPFHKAYDFYSCLEQPHGRIEGYALTAGNGLIGSIAYHPILLETIHQLKQNWDKAKELYPQNDRIHRMKRVQARTYLALSLALQKTLPVSSYKDIVFPASYFFASEGIDSLYSQHFYNASWAKPYLDSDFDFRVYKTSGKLKAKISSLFILLSLSTASLCCIFYLLGKKKAKS